MRKRYKRLLADTKLQYEISGLEEDKKRIMYLEERIKKCRKQ